MSSDGNNGSEDGEMIIERMPMFGFLEIPSALNKQFRVPAGCVITKKLGS
jgi:hypothetical protein